jgi:hypothetical protein
MIRCGGGHRTGERVAIEVLDARELIPGIKQRGIFLDNLTVAQKAINNDEM